MITAQDHDENWNHLVTLIKEPLIFKNLMQDSSNLNKDNQ